MYRNGLKRGFDIILGVFAALLLSPLLILTAIAIKLSDPGPIIFRQRRIGRDGRSFDFYKFRSMPADTPNKPSEQLDAVRLSWIGKLIRRTNIDELPQIWNILRGDMSIVGPRPPIPDQIRLVELRESNGALRCRPGLTGWAQVNSFDGMTVEEKAALDGHYAQRVTLGHDIAIIARTFAYLLRPPPTY